MNGTLEDLFRLHLVFIDKLGISFQDVDVARGGCSCALNHGGCRVLSTHSRLHDSLPSGCSCSSLSFQLLNRVVSIWINLASSTHLVHSILSEKPMTVAFVTIKSNRVV